jgi:hypothetical protein
LFLSFRFLPAVEVVLRSFVDSIVVLGWLLVKLGVGRSRLFHLPRQPTLSRAERVAEKKKKKMNLFIQDS